MKHRLAATAIALLFLGVAPRMSAQATPSSVPAAPGLPAMVNAFLDCSYSCDFDFIRTEISYVNWVRDRTDADVHILITSQNTGGGGSEYTLAFLGARGFLSASDTLQYVATINATSDETRKGLTRAIKLGLVRFVARTSVADRLEITFAPAPASAKTAQLPQEDRWRAWVFSLSANGYLQGEKRSKFMFGNESFSANRTTEGFKSGFEADFSYSEDDFIVSNDAGTADTTLKHFQRDWGVGTSQIKSLTQHLSAGLTGSLGSNSYYNQDRYIKGYGAVEYDLFPYKESTRRQLRVQYGIGVAHYDYADTTIYFKVRQTVPVHYLSMNYSTRQPWGSSGASVTHNALLNDPSIRSTRINGNTSVRLFKGLSVYMNGGYSWIHDQLYLPKGSVTTTNVLLRQQQLKTSYRYNANLGLSYSFGSIFNNVVNPRFGGGTIFTP